MVMYLINQAGKKESLTQPKLCFIVHLIKIKIKMNITFNYIILEPLIFQENYKNLNQDTLLD